MSIYRVELDDGRVFRIEVEGNTPPTEEDIMAYIENNPQSIKKSRQQADKVKPISMDDIDTSWTSVAKEGGKGLGLGLSYGTLKSLNGRTFGFSDYAIKNASKLLGGNKNALDEFYKDVESIHPAIKYGGIGLELHGNYKTGGKLLGKTLEKVQALEKLAGAQNAPKHLKALAKLSRVGYLPATGFAESAAIGGFGSESLEGALTSGIFGAGTSGTMGAIGAGARKIFSAADAAPKLKQGFPEAVKHPETTQALNTSVGSNRAVAEGVLEQVDDVKRTLNKEVVDDIEKVYGKANYEEGVNQARANFKTHMNENSGQQIFDLDDKTKYIASSAKKKPIKQKTGKEPSQLQENAKKPKVKYLADELGFEEGQLSHRQEQVLKRLWDDARESATSRAAGRQGDYGHIQRVAQDLNGLIRKSKQPQPISTAGESQVSTAELIDLRNKFMSLPKMKQNPYNAPYAKAMRLQDAYEDGLQHTSNSVKKYDIQSPEEQLAFERGVMDRVKMNPETTNIASKGVDMGDVLANSKVPNANNLLTNIRNHNNYYNNAESLRKKAYNKVWGGTVGQNIPTGTSAIKMVLDTAQDMLTGRKYRKLGKYILNPQRKIDPLNIIPYYNFGQQSTNALIRALSEQESK